MCQFANWFKQLPHAGAVLATSIAACGTPGAPETEIDRFEPGKCFGLDRNIAYLADRSSQSGIPIWEHRFTFANSFDFAPSTPDWRQITYAVASFDPSTRKLTIRFLSPDGRLIHDGFVIAAAIRQCTENHTEIFFQRSTSADGARSTDRISVKISRVDNVARVVTEMDRTQYILFVPVKRAITYVAEFGLPHAGH